MKNISAYAIPGLKSPDELRCERAASVTIDAICRHFNITREILTSGITDAHVVRARQVGAYLLRKIQSDIRVKREAAFTHDAIATKLGYEGRYSSMNAVKMAIRFIKLEPDYASDVAAIMELILKNEVK